MKTSSFKRVGGHVVGPRATFHWGIRKLEIIRFKMVFVWWKSAEKKTDKFDSGYPPTIPIVQSITCSVGDEDGLV